MSSRRSLPRREGLEPVTDFPVWETCGKKGPHYTWLWKPAGIVSGRQKGRGRQRWCPKLQHGISSYSWAVRNGIRSTNFTVKPRMAGIGVNSLWRQKHWWAQQFPSVLTWHRVVPNLSLSVELANTLLSTPQRLKSPATHTLTKASSKWNQSCQTWWLASACAVTFPSIPKPSTSGNPLWLAL